MSTEFLFHVRNFTGFYCGKITQGEEKRKEEEGKERVSNLICCFSPYVGLNEKNMQIPKAWNKEI